MFVRILIYLLRPLLLIKTNKRRNMKRTMNVVGKKQMTNVCETLIGKIQRKRVIWQT